MDSEVLARAIKYWLVLAAALVAMWAAGVSGGGQVPVILVSVLGGIIIAGIAMHRVREDRADRESTGAGPTRASAESAPPATTPPPRTKGWQPLQPIGRSPGPPFSDKVLKALAELDSQAAPEAPAPPLRKSVTPSYGPGLWEKMEAEHSALEPAMPPLRKSVTPPLPKGFWDAVKAEVEAPAPKKKAEP